MFVFERCLAKVGAAVVDSAWAWQAKRLRHVLIIRQTGGAGEGGRDGAGNK